MNVVMLTPFAAGDARFVEVQGTAEGMAFTRGELDSLLGLAELGLVEIAALQREMVAVPPAAAMTDRDPPGVRLGQPRQGGRDRLHPRRRRRVAAASRRRSRGRRGRRLARGQRPPQGGCDLRRHRDGGGRRRHRARGRRARRSARCVRRAVGRRGLQLRRQPAQAARASSATPTTGAPSSAPWRWCDGRTGRNWSSTESVPASSAARSAAPADSATTPCSCRSEADGRTFAEMSEAEKHAVSHRGRAFRRNLAALEAEVRRRSVRREAPQAPYRDVAEPVATCQAASRYGRRAAYSTTGRRSPTA